MSKRPDNPPAFPQNEYSDKWTSSQGISMRDYFAAKAMHGLISSARDFTADDEASAPMKSWDDYAKGAYQIADAMLATREK